MQFCFGMLHICSSYHFILFLYMYDNTGYDSYNIRRASKKKGVKINKNRITNLIY